MLEELFGCKSVEKILLFLFVNEKGYGAQIQQRLKTSLTPIQKSFTRLEKGGILSSYYEGKTRIYRFNPAYPLLSELETLLKKAYTLLTPLDKKAYCSNHLPPNDKKLSENKKQSNAFWQRLKSVNKVTFLARTKSKETAWTGKGTGEVLMSMQSENVILFQEKGTWKGIQNETTDFSNTFRWTLDKDTGLIALEHLRYGVNHPVFLFYLAPSSNHSLESIDSHLCEGDIYIGKILYDTHCLQFNWRIIGPKKMKRLIITTRKYSRNSLLRNFEYHSRLLSKFHLLEK